MNYDPSGLLGAFGSGGGLVGYAILVVGLWPTLEKAGLPGWGALIPIYNVYLIFKLATVSGVWMLLLLAPIVNVLVVLWVAFKVAEAFGHGVLMGFFGLFLFAPIGLLIIGYGSSAYRFARFDAGSAGHPRDIG